MATLTVEIKNNEPDFALWEREFYGLQLFDVESIAPEAVIAAEDEVIKQIGAVAIGVVGEVRADKETSSSTLASSLKKAKEGNNASFEACRTNVATDVAERLFKTAHQTKVRLQEQEGRLVQNSIPLLDIHKNTFLHMDLDNVMRERTNIECRNLVLFEKLIQNGVLDTYDAVVFSNTPINIQTRADYRFFTDTESLSIQYLKKEKDGLVMETAMVAGKKHKDAERHDFWAVGELVGRSIEPSDNDLLKRIMLVPKSDSDGVHTVVEQLDDILDGTFYGEDKPRQDYEAYQQICEQRTADFSGIVQNILTDLLNEADTFDSPYQAVERLDELSDTYCISAAISRRDIDEKVFGAKAATHIEDARFFHDMGDNNRAEQSLQKAADTSESSSCPFKLSKTMETSNTDNKDSKELTAGKKQMTCPFCKERTSGDPCASEINCTKCSASTKQSAAENRKRAREYKQRKRHSKKAKGILALWNIQK